jgi:hypothetical protein
VDGLTVQRRWRPVLAGLVALVAVAVPMNSARGQEAGAATPLKAAKEAYYTFRTAGSLPPVLTKQVPPSAVCLVAPAQVCGPEVDALKVTLGLDKGLPIPDVPDFMLPQPVEPGTLPIGMIGGQTRYVSALRFDLPSIPKDALVEKFDLVLDEGSFTFSIESPAFRAAVLAGLSQYPNQNPAALQAFLAGVAAGNPALAAFEPTGIEACLVRSAFTAGPSQDPAARPQADCLIGATGKRDMTAGTWTFDLAGIVQEWVDGAPNEGIYFGPLGAQNVAYGDPDPSTNFQVSLKTAPAADGTGPRAVVATGEKPPELTDLPLSDSGVLGESLSDAGPVDNVSTIGSPLGSSGVVGSVDTGATAKPASERRTLPDPSSPWWLWLLVPIGVAGCYALAQALDATPEAATRRAGAMTRLVEARRSGSFAAVSPD